jgi:hypothetical protein
MATKEDNVAFEKMNESEVKSAVNKVEKTAPCVSMGKPIVPPSKGSGGWGQGGSK